eukprot:8804417-Pyramimonas_sp.AAC.1
MHDSLCLVIRTTSSSTTIMVAGALDGAGPSKSWMQKRRTLPILLAEGRGLQPPILGMRILGSPPTDTS